LSVLYRFTNRIRGEIVGVVTSAAVDRGFVHRYCQTKDLWNLYILFLH